MTAIYTIGYEGQDPENLIRVLKAQGIRILLDVRLRPSSRKKGFSKNGLAKLCGENHLEYRHDKRLGTPAEMLDHVRSGVGYNAETSDEYLAFLRTQTDALQEAESVVKSAPTCLMCFEADPRDCHRRIVAEELSRRSDIPVVHIRP